MMDKFIHVWIMVFVVTFAAFTVKSSDDIQPDSVLKTETRSVAWPYVLLQDRGDDSDKSKTRASSRSLHPEHPDAEYTVCLVTAAAASDVDSETTDNVRIRAFGEHGIEWRYDIIGQPAGAGRRRCFQVSNVAMTQVNAVKIGLDGEDKWFPLYVAIYVPDVDRCYYCGAYTQCSLPKDKCMVWRQHARVVDNCEARQHAYCVEN